MKVLAAMSGGVDSSVATARMVDAGHDVVGVHLALSSAPGTLRSGSRGCCSKEDAGDARRVADVLGIPFYVWDFAEKFKEDVIDDFVSSYARGETPNPCVRCNQRIKFSALSARALALGFDAVATGHYARLSEGRLRRAVDRDKDQSYVLGVLDARQLAHAMFPLGDTLTTKDEIRAEAERRGLAVARKPDSHDICFIPDGDTRGFLAGRVGAVERGRQARGEVLPDARLVQPGKQRIGGHLRARRDVGEGAVALEQHGGARQGGGDLVGGAVGEPGGEQPRQRVAVAIAVALRPEVHTQRPLERRHRGARAGHVDEVAKVPARQGDNHERGAVAAGEVLAVLAVDGVTQPLSLRPVDLWLGEQPEISRRGQRHVLQRQADARAHPGPVAVADGGDDGERRVEAAAHVPGGQHMVDRTGVPGRTGDERVPDTGVDGVIHCGGSVTAPQQLHVDDVGSLGGQHVMAQPGQAGGVGDDDAVTLDDEALHQLLALVRAQIDGGRTLALVQSGPVDRGAALGQRPSLDVGGPADRVDADHLRAKLTQRHAAQRCRDEAGHLDDGDTAQGADHAGATRSKIAASPWPPPMHIVSNP
jgi:hypothetical protein